MKTKTLAILLVTLLALAGVASAENEPIGRVKTASGTVTITTAGQARTVEVGAPIFLDDVLETGADGSLGLVFSDESRLTLGPDTSLTVDEYVYAPDQEEVGFLTKMARGTLLYVSGLIAKSKPEAVSVETPVGTIGIRGTRFLVGLVEEAE